MPAGRSSLPLAAWAAGTRLPSHWQVPKWRPKARFKLAAFGLPQVRSCLSLSAMAANGAGAQATKPEAAAT